MGMKMLASWEAKKKKKKKRLNDQGKAWSMKQWQYNIKNLILKPKKSKFFYRSQPTSPILSKPSALLLSNTKRSSKRSNPVSASSMPLKRQLLPASRLPQTLLTPPWKSKRRRRASMAKIRICRSSNSREMGRERGEEGKERWRDSMWILICWVWRWSFWGLGTTWKIMGEERGDITFAGNLDDAVPIVLWWAFFFSFERLRCPYDRAFFWETLLVFISILTRKCFPIKPHSYDYY